MFINYFNDYSFFVWNDCSHNFIIYYFQKWWLVDIKIFQIIFIVHIIISIIIQCLGKNKEIKIEEPDNNLNLNIDDDIVISSWRIRLDQLPPGTWIYTFSSEI